MLKKGNIKLFLKVSDFQYFLNILMQKNVTFKRATKIPLAKYNLFCESLIL